MIHLIEGCVIEGSMVFCQKNILEHSISLHADYMKRCVLTHRVSQILYLAKLISEIKSLQTDFLPQYLNLYLGSN